MLAAGVSTLDVPGTRRWADAHALGLARKAPPFARVLGDALSRTGAFPGRGVTQRRQKGSRSVGLSVGPFAVKQQQQRYPRITTTPWAGSVPPPKKIQEAKWRSCQPRVLLSSQEGVRAKRPSWKCPPPRIWSVPRCPGGS